MQGDISEDPEHPKELFPNVNICEQCQDESGSFQQ